MGFVRRNPPSHGQVVNFEYNLSVKLHLFTDNMSILSQLFTVIGSWWRAGQPCTEKKLNIHADSPKLVKPSSGIARGELRGFHGYLTLTMIHPIHLRACATPSIRGLRAAC